MRKSESNKQRILSLLGRRGSLSIGEASSLLGLSEPSLRRYFAELEASQSLIRVHGGVRLPLTAGNAYRYDREAESHQEEKRRIADRACALLAPHARVFLDSGTTLAECSRALAERLAAQPIDDLQIVTNSMACCAALANRCAVTVTGGRLRADRMDFCGAITLDFLRRYTFTHAFLGVDGISDDGDLGATDEETAALSSTVLQRSRHAYILADSSKFGRRSFVPYGSLAAPQVTLITDRGIPAAQLDHLRAHQLQFLIV